MAILEMESELGGRDNGGISRRLSKSWSCQRSDKILAAAYILVGVCPDTAIFNILKKRIRTKCKLFYKVECKNGYLYSKTCVKGLHKNSNIFDLH